MNIQFKKAEKSQVKLRIAITGPAGSGKTLGALLLARGIHPKGKIAGIDTENGTMSLYGDRFEFDVATMQPPYLVRKYVEAIEAFAEHQYDVGVVDSLSHAWAGEGGILQQKELLDARAGSNSFVNWGKMTPEQNKLVNAILHNRIDLICTMRSKTEYVMGERNGKQAPQKVGMAPVQRDGFEYEFDIVFDVDANHMAKASKDRTGLFGADEFFQLNESVGQKIAAWRASGKPMLPNSQPAGSSGPGASPPREDNIPDFSSGPTPPPPPPPSDAPASAPPLPPGPPGGDANTSSAPPAGGSAPPLASAPNPPSSSVGQPIQPKTKALLNTLVLEQCVKSNGFLNRAACYERLRGTNLTESLGLELIGMLKRGDVSFFTQN